MIKIKNSRKTKLAMLFLCALTLNGCQNIDKQESPSIPTISNNSIIDEELNNHISYSITDTTVSIKYNNYGDYEEINDTMYEEINEALTKDDIDALFVDGLNSQVDFNKIELNHVNMLWIEYPQNNFDYKPFYKTSFSHVSITIDEETNIEALATFLKNLKLKNGLVVINFRENRNINDQNICLNALANVKGLNKLQISSSIIKSLDYTDIKAQELTLFHDTINPEINYKYTLRCK